MRISNLIKKLQEIEAVNPDIIVGLDGPDSIQADIFRNIEDFIGCNVNEENYISEFDSIGASSHIIIR